MDELDALMAVNGGYFTRAQALRAGLTDRDLQELRRLGNIVRLRQGAYTSSTDHGRRTAAERHVVLLRAAMAAQRRKVAATGLSAAAVWGLDLYRVDLETVHLVRLERVGSRKEAGIVHHVARNDITPSLVEVGGILTTDLSRTVWDLARFAGVDAGVVAADSALRRRPEIGPELVRLARELRHQPCARQAWLTVRLADGRSESPGESIGRIRFVRFGLPAPEPQFVVTDEDGNFLARSDFGWPEWRHLGEFDGTVKYGKLLRPGESPTDVVVREKRREDLVRGRRYGMSRFVWSSYDVGRIRRTVADLWDSLRQSHRLYVLN